MLVTGVANNFTELGGIRGDLPAISAKKRGVRRDGSAAIDMAYVACGRFDGFWEEGLNPWDIAAGVLLINEAGGRVSNYDGTPLNIYKPPICASNGSIHEEMLTVLR